MRQLAIIGAGGFGREVLDVVEAVNAAREEWSFVGFFDDGAPDEGRLAARNVQHLGGTERIASLDAYYSIGIGTGLVRQRLDEQLRQAGRPSAVLVHPSATCGGVVALGDGAIVTAGVRITTNVSLGRHVHVNINSTIGHDCQIGDYVTINPGVNVSGEVTIGKRVMLGTGSAVLQGLSLGDDCIVGAGAVVTRDVPSGATVVGVPAKPLG